MTCNKNENAISFTRLSFASEDAYLAGKIVDEGSFGISTSGFRNYVDARSFTHLSEHEGLQAQILLAQIVQESDE